MAYLNLDPGYFTHIKTQRLVGKLGLGAELLPLMLWCHAAIHYPSDGVFPNYSAEELKQVCKWPGDATAMLLALLDIKVLLEVKKETYKIHGWEEHQGHIIVFKERARANANKRWDKYRSHKKNANSIATGNASFKSGNAPYLTIPNHTIPTNKVFRPPTLEEVTVYCQERKKNVDPHKWHSWYTANGWLVGKNKMRDWKAAVRTWENSTPEKAKKWL